MRLLLPLLFAILVAAGPMLALKKKRGACPPPMSSVPLKDYDSKAAAQGIGALATELQITFGENADNNCRSEILGIDIKVEDMMTQCKDFCGHGALPIVMGSEEYGMDLEDMNKICLNTGNGNNGIKGSDEDLTGLKTCEAKSRALENIEDAMVDFLAKWKVMDFGILLMESDILTHIDKIEKKMNTPQFRDNIRRKNPEEKVEFMKKLYKSMLTSKEESTLSMHSVKQDVQNLKKYSDLMWTAIKQNLAEFKEYISKCNNFYPRTKDQTYLKDLCIQDGSRCLEISAACCCAVNPIVPTNKPTMAPTLAPTAAPTEPPTPAPPTPKPEPGSAAAASGGGGGGGSSLDDEKRDDDDFFDDDPEARRDLQQIEAHIRLKQSQHKARERTRQTMAMAKNPAIIENHDHDHSDGGHNSRQLTNFPGMCAPGTGTLGDNAQFGVPVDGWNKRLEIVFGEFADQQCRSRVENRQITTEHMFSECKAFCGEGAVPLVLGSDTFGLNLGQMNDVCMKGEIRSDLESMRTARQCPAKKRALADVENSVADFLASLRVLNYAKLRFVSGIREQVEKVEKRLKDPRFFDRISRSDDKPGDLARIYGGFLGGSARGDATFDLAADADRLADRAETMERVMSERMRTVTEFLDECDGYFPVDGDRKELLLDICRQSGSRCLTGDPDHKAQHAGCCCGHNPLVKLSGMLQAVRAAGGGRGRARALQEEDAAARQSPCAKALARSESKVTELKEQTSEMELTRARVNQIEFAGVCGRAEQRSEATVGQYLSRTSHPQVQEAKLALEEKYVGDVPLEPLPEGGCKSDLHETDKSATCSFFSKCKASRNAECVGGHCQCRVGACSDGAPSGARCLENESAEFAERIRCVTDLTETDAAATCGWSGSCRASRLASCVKGKCTCDGGNICSDRAGTNAKCVFQKMPTPFPNPDKPPPVPTPAPVCLTDLTSTDKKATCGWFGSCHASRNSVCVKGKCTCRAGSCNSMDASGARCVPSAAAAASTSQALAADGHLNERTRTSGAAAAAAAVVACVAAAVLAVALALVVSKRRHGATVTMAVSSSSSSNINSSSSMRTASANTEADTDTAGSVL